MLIMLWLREHGLKIRLSKCLLRSRAEIENKIKIHILTFHISQPQDFQSLSSFSFTSNFKWWYFLKITSWQSQRSNAGNCKIRRKWQVRRNSKKRHASMNWRTSSDIKNRSCHQLFFFGFDVIFWMVYGWFHIIVDVFIQAYKKTFFQIYPVKWRRKFKFEILCCSKSRHIWIRIYYVKVDVLNVVKFQGMHILRCRTSKVSK